MTERMNSAGSTRPKEDMVKKLTRVLVFSLAPDSNTMQLLRATLAYLKPFFHPLQVRQPSARSPDQLM